MRPQLLIIIFLLVTITTNAQENKSKDTTGKVLDEVVVTGQYEPQPLKNSVYKVKTITAERIKLRAATDIVGVLNSELGMRFSTDNTLGESDTKILGMGGSRVKVLIDGVPMVDRDATKQSITQIDIYTIEKIEIVEGPMSVVYGTDALAGVINIITKKRFKSGNNLSVLVRVQEETIADSYSPFADDGIHNENLTVNWNNNHWRATGYVTRNNFGGFADTASFPAKVFKPKGQWIGGGTFGYRSNKVNAWYRLDYLHENLFAASPMNTNNYISFQQFYIANRYTHQAQTDWTINSKLKLNNTACFQDYTRYTESYKKNYLFNTNTPDISGVGFYDVSKFQSWFFRSTAALMVSTKVSLQSGIDIKYDKSSGQRIAGKPSITDYSLFVSSEIKAFTGINIRPGFRISKNSVYDAPPIIPSINAKIALNKQLDLRLSYAKGFRAPILRELYFNFFDANHSIQGNPNLKAETSNSFMASITHSTLSKKDFSISSSMSTFYNDYSNFIDLYAFKDASGNDIFSYFNRDTYKTIGGTFENTIIYKNLTAAIGASYIGYYNQYQEDNTLKGDRTKFAFSPEINANLTYKLTKLNANIGLFYKYTGKVPTYIQNSSNDIVLSQRNAFHWADLTASKQIFKLFTVQTGIKNLFNVTNLTSTAASGGTHSGGSTTNYTYGRSYFLGINFQWSKK